MFGTYEARAYPRLTVIGGGLRTSGLSVEECNEPVGISLAERGEALRKPWRLVGLGFRLVGAWLRLRRRARSIPPPDIVVVGHLGIADVPLARRLWPTATIVLDHLFPVEEVSANRGLGARSLRRLVARLDRATVGAADVVVVDTDENLALLPEAAQSRSVVVPVGATDEWFQPAPEGGSGPLRVVVFGLHGAQEGAPVVGAAMERCADEGIEFTMIARAEDRGVTASASAETAVTWLDWVEAEELPRIVATHDVALGIFGCKDRAKRVIPAKVFQAAAAGCVILTSRTDPQVRTLGDAAEYVTCGDAEALSDALIALARDPSRVIELRRRSHELAAGHFTPAAVVQPLVRALLQIDAGG